MSKYIIAKSQCESMLATKELWESSPDNLLTLVHEFEASSPEEANNVYEKFINPSFYHRQEP